jgi:hypothetical protein
MSINVAGTNALGGYLISEIANTRTLFGLPPDTSSSPIIAVPGSSPATTATTTTPQTPTRTDLRTDVLAQQVANTETLFGISSTTGDTQSPGALPADSNQTAQQVAFAAIQSSNIASHFSNIATLFGSLGLGTNTNTSA